MKLGLAPFSSSDSASGVLPSAAAAYRPKLCGVGNWLISSTDSGYCENIPVEADDILCLEEASS